MTDEDNIKRLQTGFERLCDLVERIDRKAMGFGGFSMTQPTRTEIELLKQYVRGDLEPKPEAVNR